VRSVELFSGCGGLALGLHRAGFEHAALVEWNADARATLALNKRLGVEGARDWPDPMGDARAVDWAPFKGNVDLVAGGPPCQPFSIGGKHRGASDHRDMWPEAIRAVRELRPAAFLFENVRGLARPAFADYLERITRNLAHPGVTPTDGEDAAAFLNRLRAVDVPPDYEVTVLKLDAVDFGSAQRRSRVIVAGLRADLGKPPTPPEPTNPDRSAWRTVRTALAGLGEPDGRNGHVLQPGARVYPGHTGSPLDEPAKALKAGVHGVPGGENMMVRDDGSVRYFTVREAARLQGFPDEWSFSSSWSETMRQIGNAVPVELAEAVGRWILRAIEGAENGRAETTGG